MKTIDLVCKYCNENYKARKCDAKIRKYCSKQCSDLGRVGKFVGSNHPMWRGGKIELFCQSCGNKYKEKKNRINRSKYCSWKCKIRELSKPGKFANNWKGGITSDNKAIRASKEYKEWRILVFERDNYICQYCNKLGGDLNCHHIKRFADFPDRRLDINNGITLCEKCHNKIKSHELEFEDLFQKIISEKLLCVI